MPNTRPPRPTRDQFIDDVIGVLGTLYPGEQGDMLLSPDDLADVATAFAAVHDRTARRVEEFEQLEDPRRV